MHVSWDKDEVVARLHTKITAAFQAVSDLAKKRRLLLRDTAYVIAINRVAQTRRDWGRVSVGSNSDPHPN